MPNSALGHIYVAQCPTTPGSFVYQGKVYVHDGDTRRMLYFGAIWETFEQAKKDAESWAKMNEIEMAM